MNETGWWQRSIFFSVSQHVTYFYFALMDTISWPWPALTSSDHPMADAGYAHWLQLNPGLSVCVIERTHAARHSGRLPSSVQKTISRSDGTRDHL